MGGDRQAVFEDEVTAVAFIADDLVLASQQVAALEQRSRELMTQLKSAPLVAMPSPKPTDGVDVPPLKTANEMMQRIMTDLDVFVGNIPQHDDVTCLLLKVV